MKELTIEEKAKRYDEAIKRAKALYDNNQPISGNNVIINNIFPELKESEDERIRKVLIAYFNRYKEQEECGIDTFFGISTDNILAWLEKQEEKPVEEYNITGISSRHATGKLAEIIKNIESSDKVEPKFKVGDEIKTDNGESLTITKIDDKGYWSEDLFICTFDDSAKWELVEQKPAWSDEDEDKIKSILFHIEDVENKDVIDWLKSIKCRVQPKQEWSEEDESHIRYLIECLEHCKMGVALTMTTSTSQEYINWLKSLKDRVQPKVELKQEH